METRNKNRFFEGCGKEGPVRGIALCIFHSTYGPMISCQVPQDSITKDTFESVSVYLIPKSHLVRSIITVTFCNIKIVGYPVRIEHTRYPRNAFYFNLCFVCDAWARTNQYDDAVKRLSAYLTSLEEDGQFLSKLDTNLEKKDRLISMLQQVIADINKSGFCTLKDGTDGSECHLKVVSTLKFAKVPDIVKDCDVPLLLDSINSFIEEQWDITSEKVTPKLLPFMDGYNHVSKIAALADVDISLVKACIQKLMYCKAVKLIPIFQFSNIYIPTPRLRLLACDSKLQEQCLASVASGLNGIREVMRAYSLLRDGTTVIDLCHQNEISTAIDIKSLIQFGMKHNLIRRLDKVGILVQGDGGDLTPYLNGNHTYDDISCKLSCPVVQLDSLLDSNPNITTLYK